MVVVEEVLDLVEVAGEVLDLVEAEVAVHQIVLYTNMWHNTQVRRR